MFLVIDGWSTLRAEFDDLEMEIQQLAARGLTFGLHIVTAVDPLGRLPRRDARRLRLQARAAPRRPARLRGRPQGRRPRAGRSAGPRSGAGQAALPRRAAAHRRRRHPATLGDGVDDLIERDATPPGTGRAGPSCGCCPSRSPSRRCARTPCAAAAGERQILLGINEKELAPIGLDVDAEPHMLIFGDGQSGKSALLRGVRPRDHAHPHAQGGADRPRRLPALAARRGARRVPPQLPDLGHPGRRRRCKDIATYLEGRIPGPDVTPEQLRNRSWWTGAEVFVVVDDYDLVATAQSSPVSALQPLMAQARDVGLHVVVARRTGGASRASTSR